MWTRCPCPEALAISGEASHTYEENDTDALGEYTAVAGGGATVGAWSLEGTDASSFMLDGTGESTMLKFRSSPDYDNPMGRRRRRLQHLRGNPEGHGLQRKRYLRRPSQSRWTVTDVDELGALSGSTTDVSVNEGDTDALGTYTLTGGDGTSTVTWSLDGADMSDFMLDGTGMSRMLMFSSAPDYENPMGGADNDSNTYMVTVMAEPAAKWRWWKSPSWSTTWTNSVR